MTIDKLALLIHFHRSLRRMRRVPSLGQAWMNGEIPRLYVMRYPACFPYFIPCTIFQMSSSPTLPVPRGWEIYRKFVALKGRGRPMQHPGPSRSLPDAYRRRGITVGDVGIFTKFGGFDFLFNICLPANHPINQQGLPEGFSLLSPPLRPGDVYIHREFNNNTYLTSESIKKSYGSNNSSYVYLPLCR